MDREDVLRFETSPDGTRVDAAIPDVVEIGKMLSEADAKLVPDADILEALPQDAKARVWRRSYEWVWLYRKSSHLVLHWRKMLMAQFPWAELNVPPRVALPGQVVELDEGTHKGQLTYRLKLSSKTDCYLGRVIIFRKRSVVDVHLPLTIDQISMVVGVRTFEKLNPTKTRGVILPTRCRCLGMEGVALAAEAVGTAAKRGIIDVNPVEPERRGEWRVGKKHNQKGT